VRTLLNILGPGSVSMEQVHDMAKQIDLARLADAPIPLHAATLAYLGGSGE
jgi:hypothetical protein